MPARAKQTSNQTVAPAAVVGARVSTVLKPSPFLPPVKNVALADYDKVTFPGVTRDGQGLLTGADRDPAAPQNQPEPISGPSTYTRRPTTNRVGGNFPVRKGNLK